jgi:RNA polymerase-binding transcription factor
MKVKSVTHHRRARRLKSSSAHEPADPASSTSSPAGPTLTPSPSHQPILVLLRQEYERLKAEIQHLGLLTSGEREDGNDEADHANLAVEQSRSFALKRQLEAILVQVEHALHRLESGTYGLCERCGSLIHPERLQALPYASLCINCASLHA